MKWETGRAVAASGLPASARLVLIMLAAHVNARTGEAYPGLDTLAEETGYSEKQIRTSLLLLEAEGFVSVLRAGGGRGRVAIYGVNLPGVPVAAVVKAEVKEEASTAFTTEKRKKPGSQPEASTAFSPGKAVETRKQRGKLVPLFPGISPDEPPKNDDDRVTELRELERKNEGKEVVGTSPLYPPAKAEARNWSQARLRDFMAAYPPTVDMPSPSRLRPIWEVVCDSPDAFQAIMVGLEGWKASETWTKEAGKFICGAERFLNERRWEAVPAQKRSDGGLTQRNTDNFRRTQGWTPGSGIAAQLARRGIPDGGGHPGGGIREGG